MLERLAKGETPLDTPGKSQVDSLVFVVESMGRLGDREMGRWGDGEMRRKEESLMTGKYVSLIRRR